MEKEFDVIVLGAGIVGVSVANHLQRRGRRVVLIDRRDPGEETSFGNAGVLSRGSIVPVAFPGLIRKLPRYAFNRRVEMRIAPSFLPTILPWLMQLMRNTTEERSLEISKALDALLARTVVEHKALMSPSGAYAYLREAGWLKLHRTNKSLDAASRERSLLARFDIKHTLLQRDDILDLEPHLAPLYVGGTHIVDTASVSNPSAVTKAYAALFTKEGGTILKADAASFRWMARIWRIDTERGMLSAPDAVVCLGPWSTDVLEPLGYHLPFAVERGYHTHFAPKGNAVLNRPVYDADGGFVLAPMDRGIRLSTGIEFAARDARPTPKQLRKVIPKARRVFPLGEMLDDKPWLGRRPSFPDSLPVIGRAPNHRGLWAAFGHGHIGFSAGPVTGRLLAEMLTGTRPSIDPKPYAMERFLS